MFFFLESQLTICFQNNLSDKSITNGGENNKQKNEGVALVASSSKFDDFPAGSVFRKVTYPLGHRRFAKNPNQREKRGLGAEWTSSNSLEPPLRWIAEIKVVMETYCGAVISRWNRQTAVR
jgi:hypothetical protein